MRLIQDMSWIPPSVANIREDCYMRRGCRKNEKRFSLNRSDRQRDRSHPRLSHSARKRAGDSDCGGRERSCAGGNKVLYSKIWRLKRYAVPPHALDLSGLPSSHSWSRPLKILPHHRKCALGSTKGRPHHQLHPNQEAPDCHRQRQDARPLVRQSQSREVQGANRSHKRASPIKHRRHLSGSITYPRDGSLPS